jgi:hypothetical protein
VEPGFRTERATKQELSQSETGFPFEEAGSRRSVQVKKPARRSQETAAQIQI